MIKAFTRDHVDPGEEILERFNIDPHDVRIGKPYSFRPEMGLGYPRVDERGQRGTDRPRTSISILSRPIHWPMCHFMTASVDLARS